MMTEPVQTAHIEFTAPGVARLQESTLPPLAEDQVLIRTDVSLISPGTERAWFLGLPNTPGAYPQTAGYSNVGTVLRCGAQVEHLTPGTRVATPARHASHVNQHADRCTILPDTLCNEHAAFFNLTAIALQGIRKSRLELGESVVVLGAGLIGLLAMQIAGCSGALPVVCVEREAGRRAVAAQTGADDTLAPDEQLFDNVRSLCGDQGADVVIEATGHPDVIPVAFDLVRPGGRVILLGSTRGETSHVNFYRDVHRKGITIVGAHDQARPQHESHPGWWSRSDDWRTTVRLLDKGKIVVEPLITHRFDWRDATSAYALLKEWNLDALGMLLIWGS